MVALPLTAVRLGLSVAVSCWVEQPRNREVTGCNSIKRTGMSWTEASITRTELIGRNSWWLLLLLEEYSIESKTILGPGQMITYPLADVSRIRQQVVNPWVSRHKAGDCVQELLREDHHASSQNIKSCGSNWPVHSMEQNVCLYVFFLKFLSILNGFTAI